MSRFLSRRKFISGVTTVGVGYYVGLSHVYPDINGLPTSLVDEKQFEWKEWEQYFDKVAHPCLTIKEKDLNFALENTRRYDWAKDYASRVKSNAERYYHLINSEFLAKMIEETTPGDPLFTPCPSCRDQG